MLAVKEYLLKECEKKESVKKKEIVEKQKVEAGVTRHILQLSTYLISFLGDDPLPRGERNDRHERISFERI